MLIKSNPRLLFMLMVVAALWAPVNLMVKIAMDDCSHAATAVLRWVGVSIVMWTLVSIPKFRRMEHIEMPQLADGLRALLVGLLLVGPSHAMFYYALRLTSSIEATVLNTTSPIWSSLLAIFFLGERFGFRRWFAIGLGCIGAYVVTIGFGWPQFSGDSAQGNLIYLAGVILECVGMVFATKVVLKSSGIGTVTWMAVGNALCLALLPLILPKYFPIHIHEVSGSLIGALVYLIFVAGVICFTAWYHIAKNAPLSIMVICMGIEPIFAAILGHSILGEPITPKAYMGSALVLTSLFIVATEKTTLPSTRRKVLFEGTSEEYYRSEDKDEVGVDLAGVS